MALRGIQVPSFRLEEAPLAPRFARKKGSSKLSDLEDVGHMDIEPLLSGINRPSLPAASGHVDLSSPAGETLGSISEDFAPPSPHDLASRRLAIPSATEATDPTSLRGNGGEDATPSNRTLKKKQRTRDRRRRKRALQEAEEGSTEKQVAKKRRRESNLLETGIDAINLPAASTGWQGIPAKVKPGAALYTKAQLVDELGFTHVDWDGTHSMSIVDTEDRAFIILAGRPQCEYKACCDQAAEAIREASEEICFTEKDKAVVQCHGDSFSRAMGYSIGSGYTKPGNITNCEADAALLRRLADSKPFKRINGFVNKTFKGYAPRLYDYYRKNVTDMLAHDPSLAENFNEGAWAAMTVDFGPQTVTSPHTDSDNLAYGWSCITSLGDFDPHEGGHLVLWDIDMVVTFPPGCTVFIPSAVVSHSNTPISPTEHRYSVTQYSAAGLFRWVDNDFQSDESREQQASAEELEKRTEKSRTRWEEGLALFPTHYEIIHT